MLDPQTKSCVVCRRTGLRDPRSSYDQPGSHVITLRRAKERSYRASGTRESFSSFNEEDHSGTHTGGFGVLEILNENRLGPGDSVSLALHRDCEIITYVIEGSLLDTQAEAGARVVHVGEIQLTTAGRGKSVTSTNASQTLNSYSFHVGLCPVEGRLPSHAERKRFWSADRRGVLRLVASREGTNGSLHILQDVRVYSGLLDYGQHVIHEITDGRSVWVQIVRGEVTIHDMVLLGGDGLGVEEERSISITAREASEVILFDLCHAPEGCGGVV